MKTREGSYLVYVFNLHDNSVATVSPLPAFPASTFYPRFSRPPPLTAAPVDVYQAAAAPGAGSSPYLPPPRLPRRTPPLALSVALWPYVRPLLLLSRKSEIQPDVPEVYELPRVELVFDLPQCHAIMRLQAAYHRRWGREYSRMSCIYPRT